MTKKEVTIPRGPRTAAGEPKKVEWRQWMRDALSRELTPEPQVQAPLETKPPAVGQSQVRTLSRVTPQR